MLIIWSICPFEMLYLAYYGILGTSFYTYIFLGITSLFFSRAFCGWLCPHGAFLSIIQKAYKIKPKYKWIIKLNWILLFLFATIQIILIKNAGRINKVDFLHKVEWGLLLTKPLWLAWMNNGFAVWIAALSFLFGKRNWYKYWCPISLFMKIGIKINKLIKLSTLIIKTDPTKCNSCNRCNNVCSMGLNIKSTMKNKQNCDVNCVLCGECIEAC